MNQFHPHSPMNQALFSPNYADEETKTELLSKVSKVNS